MDNSVGNGSGSPSGFCLFTLLNLKAVLLIQVASAIGPQQFGLGLAPVNVLYIKSGAIYFVLLGSMCHHLDFFYLIVTVSFLK